MVVKMILFDEEVRRVFECGVNKFVDIVKVIFGLKGRNVVFEKKFGLLQIVNDGVIIVKEIELEDLFENMGVQIVREVVFKINDIVGDGIIIVIVLVQVMIREGFKNIVVGVNLMIFRKGI